MSTCRRVSVTVGAVLIGATGVLGLTGCAATDKLASGSSAGSASTAPAAAAAGGAVAEQQALVDFGIDPHEFASSGTAAVAADSATTDVASATPSAQPSAGNGKGPAARARHRRARIAARRLGGAGTLHGEIVVRTKDGTKTVVVQRGTVTAVSATSITVRSTDGYTLTWALGKPLKVVEHRSTIDASQVKAGELVALAGVKNGSTPTARLVVLRPAPAK